LLTLLSRIDAEANMPRVEGGACARFAKPIPAPPLPHPKPASLNGIGWPQRSANSAAAPSAEYSYFAYRRIISHFQLIWSYANYFQDGCAVRGDSLKYIRLAPAGMKLPFTR
jgi:hypothetical protein